MLLHFILLLQHHLYHCAFQPSPNSLWLSGDTVQLTRVNNTLSEAKESSPFGSIGLARAPEEGQLVKPCRVSAKCCLEGVGLGRRQLLSVVWSWGRSLTFLSLSVPLCEMGIIVIPMSQSSADGKDEVCGALSTMPVKRDGYFCCCSFSGILGQEAWERRWQTFCV